MRLSGKDSLSQVRVEQKDNERNELDVHIEMKPNRMLPMLASRFHSTTNQKSRIRVKKFKY